MNWGEHVPTAPRGRVAVWGSGSGCCCYREFVPPPVLDETRSKNSFWCADSDESSGQPVHPDIQPIGHELHVVVTGVHPELSSQARGTNRLLDVVGVGPQPVLVTDVDEDLGLELTRSDTRCESFVERRAPRRS